MNKKMKHLAIALIIMSIILLGANFFIENNGLAKIVFKEPIDLKFDLGRNIDEILSPEEMKEDLEQLKKDLKEVHPKTRDGLGEQLEIAFDKANELIKDPLTISEFTIITSEIAAVLEDAHTSVVGFYMANPLLPISIKVIGDEFYILEGNNLELGDKLISLGGIPIEEIYETSKKRIPSENTYWANQQFKNYAIFKSTLMQMDGKINDGEIEVVVDRKGQRISTNLKYGDIQFSQINTEEENKRYKTYPQGNGYNAQFSYYIDEDNDLAHFVLKSCENSPDYRKFLEIMFQDIERYDIGNVVVDLRGNTGGNSSVVDEFLKYVDIEEYVSFGGYRRISKAASEQRGYIMKKGEFSSKPGIKKNKKMEKHLFKGDIYALIDNGTFSSGNWFGIILKDSNIGTIVGEPSGNAPSSYGDILSFQLNNSKLLYYISYTQWIRPDKDTRYQDALYPDYEIKYTIEDYINNRDLAMEKTIELIESKH